jgi:hypothetical protein
MRGFKETVMTKLPSGWRKILLQVVSVGIVCLIVGATQARADTTYSWTYTGTGTNTANSGSGTLTTGATEGSGVQIIGVSGTFDGHAITGLLPGFDGADNIFYPTGSPAYLDLAGWGFSDSGPQAVNLFYDSTGNFCGASGYCDGINNNTYIGHTGDFSITTTTPEPGTGEMMLIGLCVLGFASIRRMKIRIART